MLERYPEGIVIQDYQLSLISFSLRFGLFLKAVTKDSNVYLRVIKVMESSPARELTLKHREQAGRDLSEGLGFGNDILRAKNLV